MTMKLKNTLLFLLIFSLPVNNLLNLDITGKKLQLTEFFFIVLFLLNIKDFWFNRKKLLSNYLDWGACVWGACLLINFFWIQKGALDTLGSLYICALYFLLKIIFLRESYDKLLNYLFVSSAFSSLLGIIGWMLTRFDYHTMLVWPATKPYPYFGLIGRAKALTTNPNMLASFLGLCFLLFLWRLRKKEWKLEKWEYLSFFCTSLCLFLTLSKQLIPIFIGALILWFWQKGKVYSTLVVFISLSLVLIYCFITHFMFVNEKTDFEMLKREGLAEDKVISQLWGKDLVRTSYSSNKLGCWELIKVNFPKGVGAGQYNSHLPDLKEKRLYPSYFPNYDPHNTYLGVTAEFGLLGAISLCMFLLFYVIFGRSCLSQEFMLLAFSILVVVLLEAILTDIMNFRHYAFFLALLSSQFQQNKEIT